MLLECVKPYRNTFSKNVKWPFNYSSLPPELIQSFYAKNDFYFVKIGVDLDYTYSDSSEPLVVNGVMRGDPAYTSLFTGQPTAAETVTLTGQKYCLQMQGDGAVVCSYGTASEDTPLVFTATAGDTVFTPTDTDAWMLTAGQYVWPVFIDPGATSVSYADGSSFNTLDAYGDNLIGEWSETGDISEVDGRIHLSINSVGKGSVRQTITTTTGSSYKLSYDYEKVDLDCHVKVGDIYGNYSVDETISATETGITRVFTATKNQTVIIFNSDSTTEGLSYYIDNALMQSVEAKSMALRKALTGTPTIAPLIELGVGSDDLADGYLFNVLKAGSTASHGLYYGCDATGPYIAATDGTTVIKEYTSWDRGSYLILGMIAPTSSTFKLLWQRFDPDGVAIDTSLQYSSAETYDGSLDPDTRLTIFVDNTAPVGIVALEIFNEPMGEDDTTKRLISKMLAAVAAKSAVEADSAPDGSLAFGDDYLMFGDDYITL